MTLSGAVAVETFRNTGLSCKAERPIPVSGRPGNCRRDFPPLGKTQRGFSCGHARRDQIAGPLFADGRDAQAA